jgi:hypothetical protein
MCLVSQQTVAQGIRRCFGAIRRADFGQNIAHVRGDGIEADAEGVSNLSVASTRSQEAQYLDLALAEVVKDSRGSRHWYWPLLDIDGNPPFKGVHPQLTRRGQCLMQ